MVSSNHDCDVHIRHEVVPLSFPLAKPLCGMRKEPLKIRQYRFYSLHLDETNNTHSKAFFDSSRSKNSKAVGTFQASSTETSFGQPMLVLQTESLSPEVL